MTSERDAKMMLELLKDSIYIRINDLLCETKPNFDDSITGINEAWDVVRKVCDEYITRAASSLPTQPAREEVREALDTETSRADENSISCMAFINVLRSIIRNSPDAYAVKVAEEAIKMPWIAQSPKAQEGK